MDPARLAEGRAEVRVGGENGLPQLFHNGINHGVQLGYNYGNVTNNVNVHSADNSANTPPRSIFSVPYPRDKKFIPRQSIFNQIDSCVNECQPVVLCGLGGTGKSQIAIEYAYRFQECHPLSFVFWIYAVNTSSILQSYRDIARKLRLRNYDKPNVDVCQLVADWFDESGIEDRRWEIKWLVVVDNLDTVRVLDEPLHDSVDRTKAEPSHEGRSLRSYLPSQLSEHRVLFTTSRNQDVASAVSGIERITVGPFTSQECWALFVNKLGNMKQEEHLDTVLPQLFERLGYLPLALSQAGAFITRNHISISGYLSRLNESETQQAEYLTTDVLDPRRPTKSPNSVYNTWKISFDEISSTDKVAAEILSTSAFLNGQQLPRWLFSQHGLTDTQLDHALGTLFGYDLISNEVGGQSFSIHHLVQSALRSWLGQRALNIAFAKAAMALLIPHFVLINENWSANDTILLLHSERLFEHNETNETVVTDGELLTGKMTLLTKMLILELRCGSVSKAEAILAAVRKLLKVLDDPNGAHTLTFLQMEAVILEIKGTTDGVEDIYRSAITMCLESFGESDDRTSNNIIKLAQHLQRHGKMDESEFLLRKLVLRLERDQGCKHRQTQEAKLKLAKVLQAKGSVTEAIRTVREVLATDETTISHSLKVEVFTFLFESHKAQGSLEAAAETACRAIQIVEELGEDDLFGRCTWYRNLADVYMKQKEYLKASDVNQKILEMAKRVHGEHGLVVAYDMVTAAATFIILGRYREAKDMYLTAKVIFDKCLGPGHTFIKLCQEGLQLAEAKIANVDRDVSRNAGGNSSETQDSG